MKKRSLVYVVFAVVALLACTVLLSGCAGSGGKNVQTEFIIRYTDDAGTHTLDVTTGMPYSLETVPYKYGYEFLGLFDAPTGGTQYVGSDGASLAPYSDSENKVLFVQFKPIDYTVILDYGGATVTGDRSITVAYDSSLPDLPKNLVLEHNEFTGWYTEANCKGTQIADAYGNIPVVSVLNGDNFKLDDSRRIYLYAGFELEKHAVTFIFDGELPQEVVQVPYNTPINQVVPKTRNAQKQAGLTWSETQGGDTFTGNVTGEMTLYVKEWAPVIELNGNGADVTPIVARQGTTIALPTPTKPLAKFLRWVDDNGRTQEITTMPATSITLNAVWQAKIEFDENGGSDVSDISQPAGENITLPMPTKDGYLFAGWYTADKERYTQTKMPSAGIALKAGWYKEKQTKIVLKTAEAEPASSAGMDAQGETSGPSADWRREVDLSSYIPGTGATVHIQINLKMKTNQEKDVAEGGFYIYDGAIVSASNLLATVTETVSSTSYKNYVFETDLTMRSNTLYLCYFAKKLDTSKAGWTRVFFSDIWVDLTYPDTTFLYL